METVVPSVPLVVSSNLVALYTLPIISNVSSSPISSHDSAIISLAQIVSSSQQKLASLTQKKFSIPNCDMGSPLSQDIIHTLIP